MSRGQQKYEKEFDKDLRKKLEITYWFYDGDTNKSCLMLRKGVYPYEYMDNWKGSMKLHYQQRKRFIAAWQWKASQMLIVHMQK